MSLNSSASTRCPDKNAPNLCHTQSFHLCSRHQHHHRCITPTSEKTEANIPDLLHPQSSRSPRSAMIWARTVGLHIQTILSLDLGEWRSSQDLRIIGQGTSQVSLRVTCVVGIQPDDPLLPDSYGSYPRTYGEQASASSSRLPSDIGMFHEQTARSYERLPQPVASSSRLSPFFQEQAQSRADHGHTSFSTSYSMPESSSGHRSGTGEPSGGEYASSTPPQENDEDDSEWMEHPSKRRKKAESERPPNNRTGKKTAIACDFCRGVL